MLSAVFKVSRIIFLWVICLSKELELLIIWCSRARIRSTLPNYFKQLYPKERAVIDCSAIFFDISSLLHVQACFWTDYKHNCSVKFLIAVTQNGAVSWLSSLFGGRSQIFTLQEVVVLWGS